MNGGNTFVIVYSDGICRKYLPVHSFNEKLIYEKNYN